MITRRELFALSAMLVPEARCTYSFVGGWNGAGSVYVNGIWRAFAEWPSGKLDRLVEIFPGDRGSSSFRGTALLDGRRPGGGMGLRVAAIVPDGAYWS